MGRKDVSVEEPEAIEAEPTSIPPLDSVVITRSDIGIWTELCEWLMVNPRSKQVRYLKVGRGGVVAVMSKGAGVFTPWRDGV